MLYAYTVLILSLTLGYLVINYSGIQGPQGPIGQQGPIGPKGPRGKTVVMPGATGAKGPLGNPGVHGPTGSKGPSGGPNEWSLSFADHTHIENSNFRCRAFLATSPDPNFPDLQVIQDATGSNSYVHINQTDEMLTFNYFVQQGPTGFSGLRGPQGPPGLCVGPQGPSGSVGATGPPGPSGANLISSQAQSPNSYILFSNASAPSQDGSQYSFDETFELSDSGIKVNNLHIASLIPGASIQSSNAFFGPNNTCNNNSYLSNFYYTQLSRTEVRQSNIIIGGNTKLFDCGAYLSLNGKDSKGYSFVMIIVDNISDSSNSNIYSFIEGIFNNNQIICTSAPAPGFPVGGEYFIINNFFIDDNGNTIPNVLSMFSLLLANDYPILDVYVTISPFLPNLQ